jgi:hypothetical protein
MLGAAATFGGSDSARGSRVTLRGAVSSTTVRMGTRGGALGVGVPTGGDRRRGGALGTGTTAFGALFGGGALTKGSFGCDLATAGILGTLTGARRGRGAVLFGSAVRYLSIAVFRRAR